MKRETKLREALKTLLYMVRKYEQYHPGINWEEMADAKKKANSALSQTPTPTPEAEVWEAQYRIDISDEIHYDEIIDILFKQTTFKETKRQAWENGFRRAIYWMSLKSPSGQEPGDRKWATDEDMRNAYGAGTAVNDIGHFPEWLTTYKALIK